jgi:hypothetical protein
MTHKKLLRALGPILAGVALGALSVTAFAAPPAGKGQGQGMKVHIDKETGQLRAPTAQEARALEETATQRKLTEQWWDETVPRLGDEDIVTLPNGTVAARLDSSYLEAFAVRIEDGKLVGLHAHPDGTELTDVEEVADDR